MAEPQVEGWTLGRAWEAVRKFWIVIVAATILGAVGSYAVSASAVPTYDARATILFSLSQGSSASDLNQGSSYTQGQMLSFAQLATSSMVLDRVIDDLDLDLTARELARQVAVTIPDGTSILEVQMTSSSPEVAANVANSVATQLSIVVDEVVASGQSGPAIAATLIDDAVVPTVQSAPNKTRDTALGAMAGFFLAVLLAFLWAIIDTRIPNEAAMAGVTDTPVLGTISRIRRMRTSSALPVLHEPLGRTSEELRRIRSALAFVRVEGELRVLLIGSANPGEGKSTFSTNFALTLAGLGNRVLLIDADLRRPRLADYFGIEGAVGLTDVLVGKRALQEARVERVGTGLDVLPAGAWAPNPAELLTSAAMRTLVGEDTREYDYVVIDGPPTLSVADANLMAPMADGVVLVVDASRTRRAAVRHAVNSLNNSGARLVGVVLNKVRGRSQREYYLNRAQIRGEDGPA